MSGQIVEYNEGFDREISLSLAEAEQEWKVKIVKKTKSAELSNYSGQSSTVVVPAFIDGNPVRKIGVFSSNPGTIEEVIIPPTVEMLTDKTFKKCSNLGKLTISEKIKVPFGAFDKCDSLCDENGCIVVGGVLHCLSAVGNVVGAFAGDKVGEAMLADKANKAMKAAEKTYDSIGGTLDDGQHNTRVYYGVKNGEKVYVGITNDVARRQAEHGERFDRLIEITNEPLTRKQARAIEQVLIEENPQFTNKINSISSKKKWYEEAITWGQKWLDNHNH